MSTVFDLKNVCFDYPGKLPALRDVSFAVGRSERIAIVGANGSGKSTLLHLLDGLYFASSGTVIALGQALTEDVVESPDFGPVFRKEVGFVFRTRCAVVLPTVWEELAFGRFRSVALAR